MFVHLPNMLTVLRILMVPIFPIIFFSHDENAYLYAAFLFLLASMTDALDGAIARKYHLISKVGTVLDPLADKLMLLVVLICFALDQLLPIWLVVLVFLKEIFMIIIGIYLYFRKEQRVIPANLYGKASTIVFFLTIIAILLYPEVNFLRYFAYLAVLLKLIAFKSYAKIAR